MWNNLSYKNVCVMVQQLRILNKKYYLEKLKNFEKKFGHTNFTKFLIHHYEQHDPSLEYSGKNEEDSSIEAELNFLFFS